MDIEKLKSIIRLANNNPNENEANLAARKACKLIAEEDFKVLSGKPTTWNDVKRSETPDFRSRPSPTGRYADPFDWMRDVINQEAKRKRHESNYTSRGYGNPYPNEPKKEPEKPKTPPKPPNWRADTKKEADYGYHFYDGEPYDKGPFTNPFSGIPFDFGRRTPPRPEKKVRKCVECGVEVETKRVTSVFRCDKCEWGDLYNQPRPGTSYDAETKRKEEEAARKKKSKVPYCRTCKNPINIYFALTDSWSCPCSKSKITAKEAALRGIKFT